MVGGTVIEVCDIPNRPDCLYVNCMDRQSGSNKRDECAIVVEKNENSVEIEIGDKIWWQAGFAMWTPQGVRGYSDCGTIGHQQGIAWDIRIPKIGYSGVRHPLEQSI